MKFTKMHGLGNDYIYINCFEEKIDNPNELSIRLSNRHFGIGGDGIVLIMPSEICDFRMRMFNADGSEGEMCGNATRCIGKYVYDNKLTDKKEITLETLGGIKRIILNVENDIVQTAEVNMGEPILESMKIPTTFNTNKVVNLPLQIDNEIYNVTCVSMGNPHCIVFVDNVDKLNLEVIGPKFENNEMFPKRINTEFVEILSDGTLKMRVWERGSGETLACGTGACATLVASVLNNKSGRENIIHLIGGDLKIKWDESTNEVHMTGPATKVFEGKINI